MDPILSTIKDSVDKYGKSREALLPVLQNVLKKENVISEYAMVQVAKELDMSAAEVYGTASFYSFMEHKKAGKFIVRICKTITCSMKGKNQLIHTIEDMLKIQLGETSSDGMFTLLETNCLGWCHEGPAMLVNSTVYTKITPEKVREILSEYITDNK